MGKVAVILKAERNKPHALVNGFSERLALKKDDSLIMFKSDNWHHQ